MEDFGAAEARRAGRAGGTAAWAGEQSHGSLSAHKVDGVRERIEAAGATLLYLPPYSPDCNPIEPAWSKIKHHLPKTKARTLARLEHAVAQALANVTSQDARG